MSKELFVDTSKDRRYCPICGTTSLVPEAIVDTGRDWIATQCVCRCCGSRVTNVYKLDERLVEVTDVNPMNYDDVEPEPYDSGRPLVGGRPDVEPDPGLLTM